MEDSTLFSLLLLGVVFYFGYLVGEAVSMWRLRNIMRNLAESMGIDVDQELAKMQKEISNVKVVKIANLETETHGDMIYLFDKEHNDFICQAKSVEELAKLAKEIKHIDKALVHHNDKKFIFVDGKSEEYNFQ